MSYPIAEGLGRVERRRRFSVEQKAAVLAEATAPGANMSEVERRHGLLPAQVYTWRRLAELGLIGVPGASELPSFVAVEITKDVPSLPALVPGREAGRGRWRTPSQAAQESGADRDRAGGRASGSRRSRCRRGGAGAGSYEENTEIFAPRARGISQQCRGGKEIRVAGDDLDHRRRCDDPIALAVDERIGADNQPADALPGQAREHLVEFGFAARPQHDKLHADGSRRRLLRRNFGTRIVGIDEQDEYRGVGNEVVQASALCACCAAPSAPMRSWSR